MLRARGSTDATIGSGKVRSPGGGRGSGQGKGPNGGGGGGSDPNFAQVRALYHFDEANGASSFVDSSGKNGAMSQYLGTTTPLASPSKFGNAIKVTGGYAPSFSGLSNLDLGGTQDFCIEFWWYPTAVLTAWLVFYLNPGTSSFGQWAILYTSGNIAAYAGQAASWNVVSGLTHQVTPTLNTWHHVAFNRRSNVFALYLDGVKSASTQSSALGLSSSNQGGWLGGGETHGANVATNHSFDDFRITYGDARYNASFTPPTAAFPNS